MESGKLSRDLAALVDGWVRKGEWREAGKEEEEDEEDEEDEGGGDGTVGGGDEVERGWGDELEEMEFDMRVVGGLATLQMVKQELIT